RGLEARVLREEDRTHAFWRRSDRAQGSELRANRSLLLEAAEDRVRPGSAQPADLDQLQGGANLPAMFRGRKSERCPDRGQDREGHFEITGEDRWPRSRPSNGRK